MTTWGFQECARDSTNGAYGAAIPKLLLRHLPRHYPANSVYALFPFFTPATSTKILTDLGVVAKYDKARPSTITPIPKIVDTIAGIDYVFSNPDKYKVTYAPNMYPLTNNFGFMLVFDEKTKCVVLYFILSIISHPSLLPGMTGTEPKSYTHCSRAKAL